MMYTKVRKWFFGIAAITVSTAAVLSVESCSKVNANSKNESTKKEVLLQSSKSWNEDAVPAYLEGTPQCTVLKITVAPHSRLDVHKHTMMNCAYILKGQLHVVDNQGKEITVKEGDTLLECVGRNHYGENLTDEEVVLLVFYAGVEGEPLSVNAE